MGGVGLIWSYISRSRDGRRVWVVVDKVSLVKYGDTWRREGPPSADDLKDNFSPINESSAEAITLFQEAEAWLARENR